MDEEPDAVLIEASIAEPGRFGSVFDRHAAVILRYLVRRVGPDDAENLLGEVFRIAFERRVTFDLSRPDARPWLYGIATNVLAKHWRGEGRRLRATVRLVARESLVDDVADPVVERLDADSLWARVAHVIGSIPDGERDVLILVAWEGLSYEQVAAALEVPVGTVRSRLNRARRRVRELIAGSGE